MEGGKMSQEVMAMEIPLPPHRYFGVYDLEGRFVANVKARTSARAVARAKEEGLGRGRRLWAKHIGLEGYARSMRAGGFEVDMGKGVRS
jgi:hypothetical protein